jgi:fatty acid desaturase
MELEEIYRENTRIQGRILKFRADRAPVVLVLGLFAVQLAAWAWLSLPLAVLAGLLLLPLLCSAAIYNHHQQHHNAFNSAVLNRAFETILGTQTLITSYAWVLHHNYGHHPNYMNQPPETENEDESRWARRDGSVMGKIEYTLNLLLRAPYDALRVGLKRPRVLVRFALMTIPWLALQLLLLWLNPWNYLAVILLPAFCMLLYVYYLTHEHHSGLYTKNPYEASRNRIGRLYNLRTFNLGYHTAHHVSPYIHWSLLPEYHRLIADRIPPHCYIPCR